MNMKCIICKDYLTNKVTKWSFYCDKCNYWGADLVTNISDDKDHIFNNLRKDEKFISHLDSIRIENFNKILAYIDSQIGSNKTILDVGCASGLFMEMAEKKGHKITGVEPNPLMYRAAMSRNLNVINGYFPDNLNYNTRFDIIIFNDVFEHIPDVNHILLSCYEYLSNQGRLIINIPNSDGIIFRISKILTKYDHFGLWNRLWQTMFYTPHLHYFNPSSLELLVGNHKFKVILKEDKLESLSLKGLWERVSIDTTNSFSKNLIAYLGIVLLYPFIKLLPRDSFFAVYSK